MVHSLLPGQFAATSGPEGTVYLSPAQAAAAAPGSPNHDTVIRWIRKGIRIGVLRTGGGRRRRTVRLPAVKCGGRWSIDAADLRDFLLTLTHSAAPPAELARITARATRLQTREADRKYRRAMDTLRALGVKLPASAGGTAKTAAAG